MLCCFYANMHVEFYKAGDLPQTCSEPNVFYYTFTSLTLSLCMETAAGHCMKTAI